MATVVHPTLKEMLAMMQRTLQRHPDPGVDWERELPPRPDVEDEDEDEGYCPDLDEEDDDGGVPVDAAAVTGWNRPRRVPREFDVIEVGR